jgi:catechol 2,3-dioxygenase
MTGETVVTEQAHGGALLADDTRLGPVALTVPDLQRSTDFYTGVIGLELLSRGPGTAELGAGGAPLVSLHEDPAAQRPGRVAGLYHFALLFPTREELARAGTRIARSRTPIDGASDHGTHEAIYLPDPDGIGIELAADRPRELWPDLSRSDFFSHGPAPLDVRDLLATVAAEEPSAQAAPGLRMGHIHLHVGDLEHSTRFYRDGIGFEVMTTLPTAVFVSFARYHHHLAYNLWHGRGAPPAPADAVGLRHWTLILGSDEELAAVRSRLTALGTNQIETDGGVIARDPAGIAVRLAVATGGAV